MKQAIGENIALYRKKAGYTQEQLAEKMHVTAQAVSKWENGLSCPDLECVGRLAEILNTTADGLLGSKSTAVQVKTADQEQVKKRILSICVQVKEGQRTDVTVRFPVELVLKAHESGTLPTLLGDADAAAYVSQAVEMIREGTVGSILDVATEAADVKIEVLEL